MARSIYARRRRITIVGLLVLAGIVALVVFFMFGQTKAPVMTPVVITSEKREEEEEQEQEEEQEEEEEEEEENPSAAASALVQLPMGRYVKLEQTVAYDDNAEGDQCEKSKVINLAEVEVFDKNGTNLALKKAVTGSSQESSTNGYINLTDGKKNNFTHTACLIDEVNDYLQIDLGSVQEIQKIVVTNRPIGNHRAIGIKVVVSGGDEDIESPVITSVANMYTLTFPENVWS